jgi:arylsulfate sulfotransferase
MSKKISLSIVFASLLSTGLLATVPVTLHAAVIDRSVQYQGQLGKVIVNPYKVAPLTAIIDRAGMDIDDIKVTVKGKPNGGVDISYGVDRGALLHHDGVPVFGLYDGYLNTVELSYMLDGKRVSESYKILTNPFHTRIVDGRQQVKPTVEVKKVAPGFESRLYAMVLMGDADNKEWAWMSGDKIHGAGEWNEPAEFYMIDTKGDIRWYLDSEQFYDKYGRNIDDTGRFMSFYQAENGDIVFGQSQKYMRYGMLGDPSFVRKLPRGYIDLSHEALPMENGHYLLRVAKKDYNIPGTSDVRNTVRDHIIEVDAAGQVVDEWDLNEVMGKNVWRKDLIMALDQRAVCLNVDMNAEQSVTITEDMPYGDKAVTGTGRNWAHINSISYDKTDDSIILSFRHQGVVKVGRDKKVKWILAAPEGWSKDVQDKVLQPVDAKGNKIKCENGKCENSNFDWTWTQHTAWLSPRGQNTGSVKTLSVFDNGDGRGFEQPALPTMKYSRAVEYQINEKDMTVKQTWEYGKERGFDWYSAVTSNVEYMTDKKTYNIFSGNTQLLTPEPTTAIINEVDPATNDVKVEITISTDKKPGIYYRSHVIHQDKLFNRK